MQATGELRSSGVNVSRDASGGHAALASAFFALSVPLDHQRPHPRARQRKAGTAI